MLTLVTGARGKLHNDIVHIFNRIKPLTGWSIYSKKYNSIVLPIVEPVSIARKIREEVADDIRFETNFDDVDRYNYLKNNVVMGLNITLRDLLTLHAVSKMNRDPEYFIRECHDWEEWKDSVIPNSLIIPDWRYPTELNYLHKQGIKNIVTIRVHDPLSNQVEFNCDQALDNHLTDYLMIPTKDKDLIYKTVERFPQYDGVQACSYKYV